MHVPCCCACACAFCALRMQSGGGRRGGRVPEDGGWEMCGDRLTGTDPSCSSLTLSPCVPFHPRVFPSFHFQYQIIQSRAALSRLCGVSGSTVWRVQMRVSHRIPGSPNQPNDRPNRWESCELQAKFQVLRMIFFAAILDRSVIVRCSTPVRGLHRRPIARNLDGHPKVPHVRARESTFRLSPHVDAPFQWVLPGVKKVAAKWQEHKHAQIHAHCLATCSSCSPASQQKWATVGKKQPEMPKGRYALVSPSVSRKNAASAIKG